MLFIGNRKECFFDKFLIDEQKTSAETRLHKPIRKGVILDLDMPWEGNLVTMFTVIHAEGKWKMYYVDQPNKHVAYAESDDAHHWVRPNLGIVEFNGSKENNLILNREMLKAFDFTSFDNMSVFYDENPNCPPDEKYKMVCMWLGHSALIMLAGADGIHFTKSRLITDDGEFDSQNRAFWSKEHNKYFCYFRGEHTPGRDIAWMDMSYVNKVAWALYDPERRLLREPDDGTEAFMRDIQVAESDDFIHWTKSRRIETTGEDFQLYNNCVFPYPGAPHIFVGFPLRYVERKAWTPNYDELCGREDRLKRMAEQQARVGLAISDGLFMSSRDGYHFTKYDEALIPPPPENPDAFVYGDGTAVPALIEVPSQIPGAEDEYMLIVRESFRSPTGCSKLVKYTIRKDGFVSLHAGGQAVTVSTKEFVYTGENLYANIATSARGYAFFTLTSGEQTYASYEIFGNSVRKKISFEDPEAVKRLSGKPVALSVKMFDCDLFAIQFA